MPRHGMRGKRADHHLLGCDVIRAQYLQHVLHVWRSVGDWRQLLVLLRSAHPEVLLQQKHFSRKRHHHDGRRIWNARLQRHAARTRRQVRLARRNARFKRVFRPDVLVRVRVHSTASRLFTVRKTKPVVSAEEAYRSTPVERPSIYDVGVIAVVYSLRVLLSIYISGKSNSVAISIPVVCLTSTKGLDTE